MIEPLSGAAYLVDWLPEAWFWLLFCVLAVYTVLDGFDFGVGLLYATRRRETERKTLHAAFGPLWKANEVWFVLFMTVLFAAYPRVYANLLSRQYLLVFVLLAGLILRGIGVKLRKERDDRQWKRYCDYAFVLGSVISPLVLGVFVMRWVFVASSASIELIGGVTLLALCVVLGATFLALKTRGTLQTEMATYATKGAPVYLALFAATGAVLFGVGGVGLTMLAVAAIATALCSLGVIAASRSGHHRAAFGSAAGLAVVFVGFVAVQLYPMVDPVTGLTIRNAVVSPHTLNVTTIMAIIFLPAVLLGFAMLYSIFDDIADAKGGY